MNPGARRGPSQHPQFGGACEHHIGLTGFVARAVSYANIRSMQNRPSADPRDQAIRADVQVAAVRWYLHYLLWSVGRYWSEVAGGLTNYVTLLDELERLAPPDEPICLVTFNYDRFLDDALTRRGVDLSAIDRYTADARFKLFKVHGSADWAAETG